MVPSFSKSSVVLPYRCKLGHYNCSANTQIDLLRMWSYIQCFSKHLAVQVYCIRFADDIEPGGTNQHTWGQGCHSEGPWQAEGTSWQESYKSLWDNSPLQGKEEPLVLHRLALPSQGTVLLKKPWGPLVGSKLNKSQQHALATRRANSILSCINRSIASWLRASERSNYSP